MEKIYNFGENVATQIVCSLRMLPKIVRLNTMQSTAFEFSSEMQYSISSKRSRQVVLYHMYGGFAIDIF